MDPMIGNGTCFSICFPGELVGGFNPSETYSSNWMISPGRGIKKSLKPPPSENLSPSINIPVSRVAFFRATSATTRRSTWEVGNEKKRGPGPGRIFPFAVLVVL